MSDVEKLSLAKLDEYLKREEEAILREFKENIAKISEEAMIKLKRVFYNIRESMQVALPVNLLDILTKGGKVFVNTFYNSRTSYPVNVYLNIRGEPIIGQDVYLEEGRYRAILILEKLEEKQ
jgi:hypothetical protein